jgi:16S rRNA (guanine966-N2)-methyltransferase
MRIIGGQWRGRSLLPVSPSLPLRPTSDRVRQAVFNVLEHRFGLPTETTRVLDLCCGSGALGLEALSRGAHAVTFLDQHAGALALAKANAASLGNGTSLPVSFFLADATRLKAAPTAADLIFFDPPYAAGIEENVLESLSKSGWVAPQSLVVIEKQKNIKILYKNIEILYQKVYNQTHILFGQVIKANI